MLGKDATKQPWALANCADLVDVAWANGVFARTKLHARCKPRGRVWFVEPGQMCQTLSMPTKNPCCCVRAPRLCSDYLLLVTTLTSNSSPMGPMSATLRSSRAYIMNGYYASRESYLGKLVTLKPRPSRDLNSHPTPRSNRSCVWVRGLGFGLQLLLMISCVRSYSCRTKSHKPRKPEAWGFLTSSLPRDLCLSEALRLLS